MRTGRGAAGRGATGHIELVNDCFIPISTNPAPMDRVLALRTPSPHRKQRGGRWSARRSGVSLKNLFLGNSRTILGANQALVAIIGLAAVLGAASLLSVPNALTAPSIDLANSIRFACAVGVFLVLVGCWGLCAVVESSRAHLQAHSIVMLIVALCEVIAGVALVSSGGALSSYVEGGLGKWTRRR